MNTDGSREKTTLQRRQLIVETAVQCFAEKGFHQTSMRDLAKRAGVSLGNVYNHFDSKNELIQEIATLEAQELHAIQSVLEKIDDPIEVLDQFIVIYLEACAEPENAQLAAEIVSEGLRNPEIRTGFLKNRSMLLSTLAKVVREVPKSEDVTPKFSATDCAELILDLIEGLAMRLAFSGKKLKGKDRTTLKTAVHRLMQL